MAEITALRKYPCPECGGDAEWSASKQALVCPYCGTIVPWTPGKDTLGATIRETELAAALSSAGSETRDWHFDKREVKCQNCQAITVFEAVARRAALRILRLAIHCSVGDSARCDHTDSGAPGQTFRAAGP